MYTAVILAVVVPLCLLSCSKATGACDEKQTIEAVADKVLDTMKEDLSFIASMVPGSELSKGEWNAIRAGMEVTVDNISQMGMKDNRFECSADVVIHKGPSKESIAVTYTSELLDSGEVNVMLEGM
jgi:hypothetical protein